MSDKEIDVSTKAMLGLYGGVKASALYALFVSPVLARQEILADPTRKFMLEYMKISGAYSVLFIHTFTMLFMTRQLVEKYRPKGVALLRKNLPFLKNRKAETSMLI